MVYRPLTVSRGQLRVVSLPTLTEREESVQRKLRAPSPALVISLIALFVALGGTTYAATSLPANSVGTKQIKNKSVTAAKIARGVRVKNATNATTAQNATFAKTAQSANALQGYPASYFALSAIEPAHVVGAASQPAFQNGWSASLDAADEALSFYKDGFGIVHLQGSAAKVSPSTGTIFTLPSGYRPAKNLYFAAYGDGGSAAYVQITSSGAVNVIGPAQNYVGLSNISLREGL
jgi:hypothetical protein